MNEFLKEFNYQYQYCKYALNILDLNISINLHKKKTLNKNMCHVMKSLLNTHTIKTVFCGPKKKVFF